MGRTVEVLDATPPMGAAFAKGLLPSRVSKARVPENSVRLVDQAQDLARLAEYARVCGFTLRDAVPPTWLHVLTFPLHVHLLSDSRSSVRLVGVVHVSNRMTLRRPVLMTERLEIEVAAENLRPHRRGALVDLVGQIRVDGEPVWNGVSTYLSTSVTVAGDPEDTVPEPFEAGPSQAQWRLAKDLGRRYRAVSGDPNPIHTNRLAAKAFGFDRPIIHGMWTHARALSALEGRLPHAYSVTAAFTRPILLPSTVAFRAEADGAGYRAAVTTKDGAKPHLLLTVAPSSPTG